MQMATGSCSMQRCPALTVSSIDISPSVQELLCHLLEVVNAALVQCSQAIFIGQVGANPTGKELADCKKKAGRVLKRYQVPLPSGPRSYKHGAQGRKESPLRLDLSLY